ncbi:MULTISPECIES: BlaI/MecI/CopY family transcriptional regulator [unclassified Parafrankia]|uniref:BlaI/MecI/CopY family transcriptional regulator n=1 Tax=Parafrankia TaxID=2994362 RepID=UPI000DA53A16|nr:MULTISPECIES: BlaI/MecI/CopY family transcriptional regulator [unclassified Parafrankia]TCJ35598.1 BlaI/MecI/CopY family transcriptional regulator [Parafrankia sp. BMG5.11]CAI7977353.1 Transcriptional regulator BlaI [Frankia sp. Hr75.2]SQD97795.1 Transcriptional regulator BlaI [Parafrankia sp. Ea1.12]
MEQLTDLEAAIMDRVWSARGPVAVRDVRELLSPTRVLAYTTVMTVMDRLYRKGWLTRERSGRSYHYQPVLSRSAHTARMMRSVLAEADDRGLALLHFVEAMDPGEYETLREAVRWHAGNRGDDGEGPARR